MRASSESETFLVTFKHCNVATAAVKHLHLCAADVKGLLDAVSHESKKKQSSVSNKSVLPSSFFWMHLRGSIRLGARNGRPKRWRGNHLRYEGRREMGKPHGLPQVDQVALFFYQICTRDLCCFVVLPGLISEDDGTKAQKKIKKINETPFYSPLESCFFFCLFPLSCLTRARKWMMWGRLYRIPFLFLLFLEYIWPQHHHRNNHHQAKKSILRSITVVLFYKTNLQCNFYSPLNRLFKR